MGLRKEMKIADQISLCVSSILDVPHIKNAGRDAVLIRVYDKESNNLMLCELFGVKIPAERFEKYSDYSYRKADWLHLNPEAISSIQSNGKVPAGAISGRKYIVSVSGLDPNDDSVLAIFVLSILENKIEDFHKRAEYIKSAGCQDEMNVIIKASN
jgi:hypothetical protein